MVSHSSNIFTTNDFFSKYKFEEKCDLTPTVFFKETKSNMWGWGPHHKSVQPEGTPLCKRRRVITWTKALMNTKLCNMMTSLAPIFVSFWKSMGMLRQCFHLEAASSHVTCSACAVIWQRMESCLVQYLDLEELEVGRCLKSFGIKIKHVFLVFFHDYWGILISVHDQWTNEHFFLFGSKLESSELEP